MSSDNSTGREDDEREAGDPEKNPDPDPDPDPGIDWHTTIRFHILYVTMRGVRLGLRNHLLIKYTKAHRTFGNLEMLYNVVRMLAQEERELAAIEAEKAERERQFKPVEIERDEQGIPIKTYNQRKFEATQFEYERFAAAYQPVSKPAKSGSKSRKLSERVRVQAMSDPLPGFNA